MLPRQTHGQCYVGLDIHFWRSNYFQHQTLESEGSKVAATWERSTQDKTLKKIDSNTKHTLDVAPEYKPNCGGEMYFIKTATKNSRTRTRATNFRSLVVGLLLLPFYLLLSFDSWHILLVYCCHLPQHAIKKVSTDSNAQLLLLLLLFSTSYTSSVFQQVERRQQ